MGDKEEGRSPATETPSKADYQEMMEDPYFQFLLAKRTRAQTWAFLSAVGAAILMLLGYAGFKVESARQLIDVQVVRLQEQSRRAESAAAKAIDKERLIAAKLREAKSLTRQSRLLSEQSREVSLQLLQAAGTNVENARSLQQDVFEQHRNLIESVRQINSQAGDNVKNVQAMLDALKEKQIPETLAELDEARKSLEAAVQLQGPIDHLTRMEQLNNQLLRIRTRETLTLRKHNFREIWVPDLRTGTAAGTTVPLRVTFMVEDLGKKFHLDWEVDMAGVRMASGRDEIQAPNKHNKSPADSNTFQMGETGYEYQVEYVNFGAFVRDFVMIRVRPTNTGREHWQQGVRLATAAAEDPGH